MNRKNLRRRTVLVTAIGLLSVGAIIASGTAGYCDPPPPHKKDSEVDMVSFGKVSGGVYDGMTHKPVSGAMISVRVNGQFADTGKTVARTDSAGYYECEAEIGRTKKEADIAKIIGGIAMGVRLPGTFAEMNRLDVDQLTVRVTAPGYKPFTGIVVCRKRNPFSFSVTLDAIQLILLDKPGASVSYADYGVARLLDLRLEPPFALPGKEVQVTLHVACPPPAKRLNGKEHPFKAEVRFGDTKPIELKERTENPDGTYLFRGTVKAPRLRDKKDWDTVFVYAGVETPYTFAQGDNEKANGGVLGYLQIIASDALRDEANTRSAAYRLYLQRDYAGAAAAFAALSKSASGRSYDDLMAGMSYGELRKQTEAAEYYRALFGKVKNGPILTLYADALLATGQYQSLLEECEPVIAQIRSKVKEPELPRHIPGRLLEVMAMAYVKVGRVEQAREMVNLLQKGWELPSSLDATVRLAEASNRLKETTRPGMMTAHARAMGDRAQALRDLGQAPEAVAAYEAALAEMPRETTLMRDITYARIHLPVVSLSEAELDSAIAAAETLTATKDGPSREFLPWHILGVLRCMRAEQLRRAASPGLVAAFDSAHEAFDRAIRYGRSAGDKSPDYSLVALHTVSAFINHAASVDFDLRESLLVLRVRPDDIAALTELGAGLLDLGIPTIADGILETVTVRDPDAIHPLYLRAVAARMRGQSAEEMKLLKAVLERAPNYAPAQSALAKRNAPTADP